MALQPHAGMRLDEIAGHTVAAGRKGHSQSVERRFAAAFVFGETFGDERFRLIALDNLTAAPFDTGKLHFHSPVGPVPMPDGQDLEIHGQYIVNAALFLCFIF